jgi:hypothetical protein
MLGKILSYEPIPLTEDIELEIMLDLLGGVLAERERFSIEHGAERGERGKFTALMGADIYIAAVTVACGNNRALAVRIG